MDWATRRLLCRMTASRASISRCLHDRRVVATVANERAKEGRERVVATVIVSRTRRCGQS